MKIVLPPVVHIKSPPAQSQKFGSHPLTRPRTSPTQHPLPNPPHSRTSNILCYGAHRLGKWKMVYLLLERSFYAIYDHLHACALTIHV